MANGEAPKSIRASIYLDGKPIQGTLKDIKQDATLLRRELDGLTVGTDAFKKKAAELAEINGTLQSVQKEVNGLGGAFGFLKTELGKIGALALGTLGFQFITQQFQSVIAANAKLSDSLADVRQTTGLTEDAARSLNSELKKVDTRTARSELLKIAEIGGQFNVPTEQLKDFVVQMDRANVVLGSEFKGGAEEITTQLALLRNNFTDIKTAHVDQDLGHIGNALIVLAQEGAATAPVVTEFAKRLAPLITTAHLTSGAILGLGATMQELAIDPERGGTAVVKLFSSLSDNVYGFAQVAGMAGDAFKKLLNDSPMEAFVKVLEGFKKGGANLSVMNQLLKDLDLTGVGSREALVKLSANTELLTGKIKEGTTALTSMDAITAQYNIKNQTFGAQLDKLSKKFAQLTSNSSLQSFFAGIVVWANSAIDAFAGFIGFIGTLTKLIIVGTVAYFAYNGVLALSLVLQKDWIALLVETEAYTKLVAVAQLAWNVVVLTCTGRLKEARLAMLEFNLAMEANPAGLAIAALAALAVAFVIFSKSASDSLQELKNKAQDLTDKFNDQKKTVINLQQNISPLIDKYDQLSKKGKLNRDEQTELKKILSQLSDAIPGAVTAWDKYGNAIGINTEKAKEYIKQQQAMLKYQNKAAIGANVDARNELTAQRKYLVDQLNRGITTESASVGTGGVSSVTRKLTDAEKQAIRTQIKDAVMQTAAIDATIKGLEGDYLKGDSVAKPSADGSTGTTQQLKLTDMTVGQLKAHVEDLNKQLDTFKKGSADYLRITKELTQANKLLKEVDKDSGKGSGGSHVDPQKKVNEYLKQSKDLSQQYKEFNAQRLAETMSANDKEVQEVQNKYDTEIAKLQKFIDDSYTVKNGKKVLNKGASQSEIDKHQVEIDQANLNKSQAVADLRRKQELDLMTDINNFRDQMAGHLETELQKEADQINQKYDELRKNAGDNDEQQLIITQNQSKELTDAKLREEKRFQEDVQKINEEGAVTDAQKHDVKLARINKQYDDEIEALKIKYGKEKALTKEFTDAVDKINANRKGEIDQVDADHTKEKLQQQRDFEIDSAKRVSDAVFSIGKNNRDAETNAAVKALEDQKTAELNNASLTADQKTAITDRYAKQEADIKLKAWKADQEAAEEQAVINGALAVLKALAQVGPLGSAFVIPGIIVETALQVATIAGQKPPQFAAGSYTDADPAGYVSNATLFRNSASGRPFVAGEAGKEWIAPNWMVKSPRYANIIGMLESARQDKRAFASGGYNGPATAPMQMPAYDNSEVVAELRLTRQAIKDQKVYLNYQYFMKEMEKNARIQNNSQA